MDAVNLINEMAIWWVVSADPAYVFQNTFRQVEGGLFVAILSYIVVFRFSVFVTGLLLFALTQKNAKRKLRFVYRLFSALTSCMLMDH